MSSTWPQPPVGVLGLSAQTGDTVEFLEWSWTWSFLLVLNFWCFWGCGSVVHLCQRKRFCDSISFAAISLLVLLHGHMEHTSFLLCFSGWKHQVADSKANTQVTVSVHPFTDWTPCSKWTERNQKDILETKLSVCKDALYWHNIGKRVALLPLSCTER